VADNAISHAEELAPWRGLVEDDPRLTSALVEVGAGAVLAARVS
jgi:hypothetical protein